MFINREKELKNLSDAIKREEPLIIIYGRRRVGKTALSLHFSKRMKRIYYLARESGNLRRFIETAEEVIPDVSDIREDWESVFRFLDGKVDVIIIDEFQNLIKEDKRILSTFQAIVDLHLKRTKLILLGSSVSMMTSKVLSYQSPLYGRRALSLKITPMDIFDAIKFYDGITPEEMLNIYGLTDGIPYYLKKVKPPFKRWLDNELANPTFIRDEVDFLLRYEFEEPTTYKCILEAIANGNTELGRIKNYCGFRKTDITPYLRNLMTVGILTRRVPITETVRTRKGRYYISDNFITFWFRFISPKLNELEEGILRFKDFKKEYNSYLGFVFEKVAYQYLLRNRQYRFTRIGKWWDKDNEIDLITIDENRKTATFYEVKWKDISNPNKIIDDLIERSGHLYPNMKKRYVIFARSFKKRSERATCIDIKEMFKK